MYKKYRKKSILFLYAFTIKGLHLARKISTACLAPAQKGVDAAELFNAPLLKGFEGVTICAPKRILMNNGECANEEPASEESVTLREFSSINDLMKETFDEGEAHVFISACGIAVRAIAPLLLNKEKDPAVIVLDQAGEHVISLLSGHLGGGNSLARNVASIVAGKAVITTATDVEGVPAIDAFFTKYSLKPINREKIKDINAALLEGEQVFVEDAGGYLRDIYNNEVFKSFYSLEAASSKASPRVVVCFSQREELKEALFEKTLLVAPALLHVGVGCRKGVSGRDLIEFVESVFMDKGFYTKAIAGFASAMIKEKEQGMRDLADYFDVPLVFFEHEQLNACSFSGHSPKALSEFGLKGVCEPAALLAAKASKLLLPKVTGKGMTLAVAILEQFDLKSI